MVRQRVYGILAGYEDQNDHDSLRSDPIFKLIAERLPNEIDLASQPTISRLENAVTAADLLRMEDWFIDRFIESFSTAPSQLTLDVDLFDDPAHGNQQLTLFHGFYEALEELRVEFSIGLAMNPRLQRTTAELLETAVNQYEESQQPQRLFTWFEYQADSWSHARGVIVKCEANSQGTNRRAIVTNRAGAEVCPQGAYDADAPAIDRVEPDMPLEARTPKQKRRYFNRRRRMDPLGEGHACTWRLRFIKVAARIVASTRRVRVLIPQGWPYFEHYSKVIRAIQVFCPPATSSA